MKNYILFRTNNKILKKIYKIYRKYIETLNIFKTIFASYRMVYINCINAHFRLK